MIFSDLRSGTSVEGNEIKAFRNDLKGKKYCYLMAGVHGDEVEGVYVLKQLFQWLKTDLEETSEIKIPLVVIPILNVDGYRSATRVNSHAVDLNRNLDTKDWTQDHKDKNYFPGPSALSEPENQYLIKLFDKFPPKFILTFHSWKPMLNFNGDCKHIAEFLGQFNQYPVTSDVGYPTPGSLGTLGPERYKAPVLTFECPKIADDKSLKDIWAENEEGLKNLLKGSLLTSM